MNKIKIELIEKINKKEAVIGILGLGYVGLPLSISFSEAGFKVIGFDIDREKIETLMNGGSYIEHINSNSIKKIIELGFEATTDIEKVEEMDALIICVPTPLNKYREPNLSYVINIIECCIPHIRSGQVVSLESTTYPGTTEEELLSRIESKGYKVGKDLFLLYSPEREDPGNKKFKTKTIPKVVGGHTKACLQVGEVLYSKAINKVVKVSSTKVAEMSKLLENIHRSVNIGLVNEMKIIADSMGIDINEVIRAAATKPFGFTPYYPGPGLGGHCIPIDPFYLTWKSRQYNISTRFIELAGEINTDMPKWVVQKVMNALNDREKSLKKSKILILGLAYKKNIDDARESPALELINILLAKGALIEYTDPHIPIYEKLNMRSVEITPKIINKYDLILLVTDHDMFDFEMILNNAKLIVDTRDVYKKKYDNVEKA
ncbi:nucleotide sugar dehydrogenase [Candidatus Pseudothioglobus singularis]|nr:nucleotide sugar dehydrogenase [Candidatus Pseudothioglobus singularis]MDB4598728.1 nucleotide sugar dehydrogenase [Candidatus Pseudothioglobus singularis]